jgi:hypothetical protein
LDPQRPLTEAFARNLVREDPEAVVGLLLRMQETLVELRAEVSQLRAEVAELKAQNRPPSAPHRRREDERTAQPKPPGRKPGHEGTCRRVPAQIDEELDVRLGGCPHCQGQVEGVMPVVQWIEELPVVRSRSTLGWNGSTTARRHDGWQDAGRGGLEAHAPPRPRFSTPR